MMQAGDAEWAGGVDGAPVYGKKSGKSLLYLFKRGSTWRVGRKPGAQNVIVSIAHKHAHVEFGSIYTSSSFFFLGLAVYLSPMTSVLSRGCTDI